MRKRKYVNVKVYKANTGRQCMHCGRPAKVIALDAVDKVFRHRVRYCIEHAVEFGAVEEGEEVK